MLFTRMISHSRRFKGEYIYTSIISLLLLLMFIGFYPGTEGVVAMFNVINESTLNDLFRSFDINSPGWILWMVFIIGLIGYYIMAVSGIQIGSKVIPTIDEDAVEIFIGSNPLTPRKYYLENYLIAILIQIIIFLQIYVLIAVFTVFVYDSSDALLEITLSLIKLLSIGIFFISLTSMVSILKFSKSWGKGIGFFYLFFAMIIETALDGQGGSQNYKNISINYYLNAMDGIFDNFDWKPFIVILLISFLFFIIGYWRIKYPEFIEKVGSVIKDDNSDEKIKLSIKSIIPYLLSKINRLPNPIATTSRLSLKFPIFTEQLRRDRKAFWVTIGFIFFQQAALFSAFPDSIEELATVLAQSNSPMLSAFSQNHPLQQSFLGFLILKFYSGFWMFYGILLAVISVSIPNRDVRTGTHDIIFANSISPTELILSRISSMVVTMSGVIWFSFIFLRIIQKDVIDIDFQLQFNVFLLLWIHYIGMGIFLVGVAMIPIVNKGRNTSMMVFIIFILFSFIPFLNEDIEFMKYISYISYFDPVGLMYEVTDLTQSFIISSLMLIASLIFTLFMTKTKYSNTDLR